MSCYDAFKKDGRKNIAKCIKSIKRAVPVLRGSLAGGPKVAIVTWAIGGLYIYFNCKDAWNAIKE